MLMVLTLSSFATYLILTLVPRISGLPFNDIVHLSPQSDHRTTRAGLIAQAISHTGIFTAPALLFAAFTHPRLREYLGLRLPGKPAHWLMVTGIMLGLVPVFIWGETWMLKHLHFGKWADDLQHANDGTIKAFLKLSTGPDLALLLSVLAILPAFGEELLFRGVLLRLFHRRNFKARIEEGAETMTIGTAGKRGMIVPIIFTALLFAAIHFNPYGFPFLFIAGVMLAMIYYLTGSLLCGIWGHFLYNGIQVSAVFLTQSNSSAQEIANGEQLPIAFPLVGIVIFALSFYALVRARTPLAPNWSLDFKPGEEQGV
jgi:membrane protease YdiL (CAAX protease family)